MPDGFQLFDDRLNLSLVMEDPDIVTPIGIAIDSLDRLFVLESHTHVPPKDYKGPDGDLIKVLSDSNGDGELDSMSVFAEGIHEGLNIAFSPEGHLYVVTSKEVWAYYDEDGDGVSENNKKLLGLTEPARVYAHAAILGIAFSPDGWMYISRGNTGGIAWSFQGTDGSTVSGYGDGGNIMRARLDGFQLEEFATGFWNPFDLKFDNYGRLMVADNDPDSRGPNRLVHAVQGGDYGYKSMFGGSGIHPYSAWDGELPGTLPYAVALGEAPSGLLNASLAKLPKDYQDQMLCSIWEESSIVRTNMQGNGLSVSGTTEVIVSGEEDFRPVAFATDSKGTIYFTDWVLRSYPNHGRGKIWKLTTKKDVETLEMRHMFDPFLPWEPQEKANANITSNPKFENLVQNLKSDDPFLVHATVMALSKEEFKDKLLKKIADADPAIRLGTLLALQKSGDKQVEFVVKQFLTDPVPVIRNSALIWIGSNQIAERRNDLELALNAGEVTKALFETYLETVKLLQPEFMAAYKSKEIKNSKSLKRPLPDHFLSSLVADPSKLGKIRVFALGYMEDNSSQKDLFQIFLTKENDPEIRLEIVRMLKNHPDKELANQLLEIALDPGNPELLRADAILSLSGQPLQDWERLIGLLEDEKENVQIEAARYLRSKINTASVKKAFEEKLSAMGEDNNSPLKQQLEIGLNRGVLSGRPENTDQKEWQALLASKGDGERGQRVFYSNMALCSTCHAIEGKGGDLGPDLSNVGQSKDRNMLITSILLPSHEMSPEWQGWFIKLKDGTIHQGRQIDVGETSIVIYTLAKGFVTFSKEDIADYGLIKSSLMPEGLERNLTDSDLKDLLSFLLER
ncbi:cytochrome c [Cyclobacterium qasimii]|uniref:Cytochrome c n=3 Tax=Cyclobacterium qasimii TaxID=1350429 RepID=A0A512CIS3_9BACT|nr:cytochrome c [Cyclobacterium qasimii]